VTTTTTAIHENTKEGRRDGTGGSVVGGPAHHAQIGGCVCQVICVHGRSARE
jgi:hypothetical protein